jgi:hypothetical protein
VLLKSRSNLEDPIMAMYESEHTKFMREWMEKHPEERAEQKTGRALWWDKPQSVEEQERLAAARVPVKSYYYDANH